MAPRRGEQVVVHVREDPERVACIAKPFQRAIRVGERLPVGERFGEERAVGGPAEGGGDARRGLGEDFAIRAIALMFHLPLGGRVGVQDGVAGGRGILAGEGAGDAALPVDERPVTIEGDDVVIACHA
jgi:hypothetical protein